MMIADSALRSASQPDEPVTLRGGGLVPRPRRRTLRLPLGPVLDLCGINPADLRTTPGNPHGRQGDLAVMCGVTRRTVLRWLRAGSTIPLADCDRLATHLGSHGRSIWGPAWDLAWDLRDDPTLFDAYEEADGWTLLEGRWRQWWTQQTREW